MMLAMIGDSPTCMATSPVHTRPDRASAIASAVVAFAPPPLNGGRDPLHERESEGQALVTEIFAVAAASWAVLMGVAPLLQVRRMLQRQSSADVSIGYLLILLPGFALWVAYGISSSDVALVIPNVVAFVVAAATIACALRLRAT